MLLLIGTMTWYWWEGKDLFIHVRLQPRAKRDEFAGVVGNQVKVRVTAPPVDDQANLRLIEFLATQFDIAKSRIRLLRGRKTRAKLLRLQAPGRLPADLGIEGR